MILRILMFVLLVSSADASWHYTWEGKLWKYAGQFTQGERQIFSTTTEKVYELLKQIPDQKVDLVFQYALKYFKKEIVEPFAHPERLFSILQAHEPENLEKICEYLQFFKSHISPWFSSAFSNKKDVWDFFANNEMERVTSVCEWALKLMGSGADESDRIAFLSEVIEIPENKLDQICLQAFKFTKNQASTYKKLNVLRAFKKTPPEKWETLCGYAFKVVPVNDPKKDADALGFFGELPPEKWEELYKISKLVMGEGSEKQLDFLLFLEEVQIESVQKLLKNDPSIDEETFDIIKKFVQSGEKGFFRLLMEKTSDNVDFFQQYGTQFLKCMELKFNEFNKYNQMKKVLEAILEIKPDQPEIVCDYMLKIFRNKNYEFFSDDVLESLNFLKEIPPYLLKEIQIFRSKLKFEYKDFNVEKEIIELLASSPSTDWEAAHEISCRLLGDEVSLEQQDILACILLHFPSQRWEPLVEYASLLFKGNMKVNIDIEPKRDISIKLIIAHFLARFPSYRLPKICEYTLKLLSPNPDPKEIANILEFISDHISLDRLETVCLRALPLIEKMSLEKKIQTLKSIKDISDERWSELEKIVPFFVKNESDIVEKTTEILRLSNIMPQVVQVLAQYGAQFKFHEMNEEEKKKFIKQLEEINKLESCSQQYPYISLSEAVKNSLCFITPQMSIDDALQIIRKFKRLGADNLKEVLEFLPKLTNSKMNAACISELIEGIGGWAHALYTPFEAISHILKLNIVDMIFEIPTLLNVSKKMKSIEEFEILIKHFPHITKILSGKEINPEFYEKNFRRWDKDSFYKELCLLNNKLSKFLPGTIESSYKNTFNLIEAAQISEFKWEKILEIMEIFSKTDKIYEYASKIVRPGMNLDDIIFTVNKLIKIHPDRLEISYENMDKFMSLLNIKQSKLMHDHVLEMMEMFQRADQKKMEIACHYISKLVKPETKTEDLLSISKVVSGIDSAKIEKVFDYTIKYLKDRTDSTPMVRNCLKKFDNYLSRNIIEVLNYVPSLITDEMEWGEVDKILSNLEKYDLKYRHSDTEKPDDPMVLMAMLILQSDSKFAKFYYDKIKGSMDFSTLSYINPLFQAVHIIENTHQEKYKQLYKKRRPWKRYMRNISPIVEEFDDEGLSLCPEFFQNKLRAGNFTLHDLPKNYDLLKRYLDDKIQKFNTYISVGNPSFIQETKKLTEFDHPGQFLNVSKKLIPYLTIVERQKTGQDYLSDSQVKLYRLLDIFQNEDEIKSGASEKVTYKSDISLSKGEKNLLKCLSEIHKCPESVSLGISEVYHPHALSLALLKNEEPQKIVKQIIVRIVENFMYSRGLENFYSSLCGVKDVQCENQQVIYALNAVGGAIGLDPWLNLEGNLDFVYSKLLRSTPQDILKIFYEKQVKPTYFFQKFKKYFDDMEDSLKEKVINFYSFDKKRIEEIWESGGISQKKISPNAVIKILKDEKVLKVRRMNGYGLFSDDDDSF